MIPRPYTAHTHTGTRDVGTWNVQSIYACYDMRGTGAVIWDETLLFFLCRSGQPPVLGGRIALQRQQFVLNRQCFGAESTAVSGQPAVSDSQRPAVGQSSAAVLDEPTAQRLTTGGPTHVKGHKMQPMAHTQFMIKSNGRAVIPTPPKTARNTHPKRANSAMA